MGGFSFNFGPDVWGEKPPGSSSGGFNIDWNQLLKTGIGAGAGLIGNAIFGGASAKNAKAQDALASELAATAAWGRTAAQTDLPAAKSLLQLPISYYQKLLSGDDSTLMEAVGPDVSTVSSQYQAARRAASEFAPRSGGRAQSLEETRYKEMADIQNLIRRARTGAPDALTQLAQILSNIGLSEMSGSNAALGGAGNLVSTARSQNMAKEEELGKGFADLISALLFPQGKK